MRWWQNEMWRQLARDVKISLELLNVHLCFAVGCNIYDYGGKTVLAVRQFLLLHSLLYCQARFTGKGNITGTEDYLSQNFTSYDFFTDRNRTVIMTLFSMFGVMLKRRERKRSGNKFNIDMHTKKYQIFVFTSHVSNWTVVNLGQNICGQPAESRLLFTAVKFFESDKTKVSTKRRNCPRMFYPVGQCVPLLVRRSSKS